MDYKNQRRKRSRVYRECNLFNKGTEEVGQTDTILGTGEDIEIHPNTSDLASYLYREFKVRLKRRVPLQLDVMSTTAVGESSPLPSAPTDSERQMIIRAPLNGQLLTQRPSAQSASIVAFTTLNTYLQETDLISNYNKSKHGFMKELAKKRKNFQHQLPKAGPKLNHQAHSLEAKSRSSSRGTTLLAKEKSPITELWNSIQCKRKAIILSSSEQDKMKRSSVLCPLCQLLASKYLNMFLNNGL